MGWENRDYNRGGWGGGAEFFGNPAGLLSWSVPFGAWGGVRVRLHFWMLLQIVFIYIAAFRFGAGLALGTLFAAVLVASVIVHEFGHRLLSAAVGGRHDEFLLWPAGGMIPPVAPPAPWPTFVAHGSGILTSLALCVAAAAALAGVFHVMPRVPLNPLMAFGIGPVVRPSGSLLYTVLESIFSANVGLVFINLLPFYWFDGGPVLESLLWPWAGRYQAINVTCIAGMCVAVPFFAFSLFGTDLLGMVFWALLFAGSFNKRRELVASGTGEVEEAIAYSAQMGASDRPRRPGKLSYWGSKSALKAAREERRTQEKIDAILAKVHAQGMQSLSWFERRTLRLATERQRRKTQTTRR